MQPLTKIIRRTQHHHHHHLVVLLAALHKLMKFKLKECDDCDLVRYCSDECQKKTHKSQHEEACKKRAAELIT